MESLPHGWRVYPQLSKEQFQEARAADIDALYAQLLSNRDITTFDEMRSFLNVDYHNLLDPSKLIDMSKAVDRIQEAIHKGEHITVYGDYDADGVTSSALLFRALRFLVASTHSSSPLDYYIPGRLDEGCGLNTGAIDSIVERGTTLIITTDCASSDVEQIQYAMDRAVDVIVTDHHRPPTELPRAYAMVNPWRNDAPESNWRVRNLCGAGVAFKLVQALYMAYRQPVEACRELLDLVAIGTIGDIVPLLGENHTLVALGMEHLNKTTNPGLRVLIRQGMLQSGRIRERDVAYGLTPRINAAGRMDKASLAFDLLTTESEEDAERYVQQLEQLNENRRQETEELMRLVRDEAEKHRDDPVIVVSGTGWHEGILGLVAGRLVEEIHKPVFVLSEDASKLSSRGSGRSEKGFNIIAALQQFSEQLERFGGHAQAAGFTIKTAYVEKLRTHLLQWNNGQETAIVEIVPEEGLSGRGSVSVVEEVGVSSEPLTDVAQVEREKRPEKMIDLILTRFDILTYDGAKKLRKLAPFGAGNPEPTFLIRQARLLGKWTSGINRQNLRLKLGMNNGNTAALMPVTGTWSKEAHREPEFEVGTYLDVVCRVDTSDDESRRDMWIKILDAWPSL